MSDQRPNLAKQYELTKTELVIDGQTFPYYIHENGPRIEPAFDGKLTTLWVPILIDEPCPQTGAPDGTVAACKTHNPVQHRDGRQPWCNACGHRRGR